MKRSKLWTYFKKEDGDAVCTTCNKRVKTSGNTSNLASHIKNKHPEFSKSIYDDVDTPVDKSQR